MYKIGDWVTVKAVTSLHYTDDGKRYTHREFVEHGNLIGQVVGVKVRFIGQYVNPWQEDPHVGLGILETGEDPPQPYLRADKSVTLWLVRLGMINKPLECLVEDISLTEIHPWKLPWMYKKGQNVETEQG